MISNLHQLGGPMHRCIDGGKPKGYVEDFHWMLRRKTPAIGWGLNLSQLFQGKSLSSNEFILHGYWYAPQCYNAMGI